MKGRDVEIPFSDELTGRLVQQFTSLSQGERIPSERDLAEVLGVSRTALRDRLMRLEAIGIIERRKGSGTYLMGLSSKMLSDTLAVGMLVSNLEAVSLLPVRAGLEREAAKRAAMRTDHLNLAHMAMALDDMGPNADETTFRDADYRFHTSLMAASGVPGLAFFAEILQDLLGATIQEVPVDAGLSNLRTLHQDIYEAVRLREPESAMSAIDAHFAWLDDMLAKGAIER